MIEYFGVGHFGPGKLETLLCRVTLIKSMCNGVGKRGKGGNNLGAKYLGLGCEMYATSVCTTRFESLMATESRIINVLVIKLVDQFD